MEDDLAFMNLFAKGLVNEIPYHIHQRATCCFGKGVVGFKRLE